MPVYESCRSLVLHFGEGDIVVSVGKNIDKDYEDEIAFTVGRRGEIGRHCPEFIGRSTDDGDTPVRMIFDKIESLDSVMATLSDLREIMAARLEPADA